MTFNFSSVLLFWLSFCSGLSLISSEEDISKDPVCALPEDNRGSAPEDECTFLLRAPRKPANSPYSCSILGIDEGCKCIVSSKVRKNDSTVVFLLIAVTLESNGTYVYSSDEVTIYPKRNTYVGRFLNGEPGKPFIGIRLQSTKTSFISYICRDNKDLDYSKTQSLLFLFAPYRNPPNLTFTDFYEFAQKDNITTEDLITVNQSNCPKIPNGFCKERTSK